MIPSRTFAFLDYPLALPAALAGGSRLREGPKEGDKTLVLGSRSKILLV